MTSVLCNVAHKGDEKLEPRSKGRAAEVVLAAVAELKSCFTAQIGALNEKLTAATDTKKGMSRRKSGTDTVGIDGCKLAWF